MTWNLIRIYAKKEERIWRKKKKIKILIVIISKIWFVIKTRVPAVSPHFPSEKLVVTLSAKNLTLLVKLFSKSGDCAAVTFTKFRINYMTQAHLKWNLAKGNQLFRLQWKIWSQLCSKKRAAVWETAGFGELPDG